MIKIHCRELFKKQQNMKAKKKKKNPKQDKTKNSTKIQKPITDNTLVRLMLLYVLTLLCTRGIKQCDDNIEIHFLFPCDCHSPPVYTSCWDATSWN